uniref:Uncharacterized protein n=1 Tax=Rhizophora mucronata TaxID=61149 RepID=A0A2P2N4D3_RHIMU
MSFLYIHWSSVATLLIRFCFRGLQL